MRFFFFCFLLGIGRWSFSFDLQTPPQASLPFSINFEHSDSSTSHTLFLEFNERASFDSKDGFHFQITPRPLYSRSKAEHGTVLLEVVIKRDGESASSFFAQPILSLERGGSASIEEKSGKNDYKLSVVSLRWYLLNDLRKGIKICSDLRLKMSPTRIPFLEIHDNF